MSTLPSSRTKATTEAAVDYARLFRDLPEPYLLFEAVAPDWRIIDTNKSRENLSGVKREDSVGRPLFSVYPYSDEHFRTTVGKNLRNRLRHMVHSGRSQQLEPIEHTHTGADGKQRTVYARITYFPLRGADDRVRYILAVARDVTEELRTAERAAVVESHLNAALTIGKVGSWVFNEDTRLIIGDATFRDMFRMTKQQSEAYTLDIFLQAVHSDDRERITEAIERSLRERVSFEEECRVIMPNGDQRWILARGSPELHNGLTIFPGMVVDMTEQRDLRAQIELARQQDRLNRRAAHVLQRRNEELEAISRSKDEFVALASHQLRTPATAVKQYIGMLLQGYIGELTPMQSEVLDRAFESNERQIEIINQILSAARVDTGRLVMSPMLVDLRTLAEGIVADMASVMQQRSHNLQVHLPDAPIMVHADLGYLRMAIENVLHNASVYTPEGGHVTVKLEYAGEQARISISDTGVGIHKKDLGKLFVKFSRIHNPLSVQAGGSGIGLYLTAEIVRLHGGKVEVESQPRKGTTFAILLPLAQNKMRVTRSHQTKSDTS